MRKKQMVLWPVLLLLAAALITVDLANAQQVATRSTTRGLLWSSFRDNGSMGRRNDALYDGAISLQYPGTRTDIGDFVEYWGDPGWNSGGGVTRTHQYRHSVGDGVWMLVKDGSNYIVTTSGPRYVTEDVQASVYDPRTGGEKDLGIRDGKSTWWPDRTTLPDDMVEIHNYAYGKYMNQVVGRDNEAEEMIVTKWRSNKSGLVMTRKSRTWSYPDYMDFIILEFVFENGSAKSYTDAYFALLGNWAPTETAHDSQGADWRNWSETIHDDWFRYTEAPNYAGPAQYKGKKMYYMWDGDWPRTIFDDTGGAIDRSVSLGSVDWGQAANELMAPAYLGLSPLAWKPPFVNDAGTYVSPKGDQPQSTHWWKITSFPITDEPTSSRNTDAQMYAMLTSPTQPDPTQVECYASAMTFGPYDMAPGDKAKVVLVYAAGSGAEAREQTWNASAGYTGPKMNMAIAGNLNAWTLLGDRVEFKKGEDVLFSHLAKAQFAYNNGYDVPDAPPDVAPLQTSTPEGNFQLVWTKDGDSAVNPDYTGAEASDIAGYRVYRAKATATGAAPREIGPWDLLDEVLVGKSSKSTTYDGSKYTFVDKESVAGFTYFYMVHTFVKGKTSWSAGTGKLSDLPLEQQDRIKAGLESGFSSPESKANYLPLSPAVPASADFDQLLKKVRAVPNPYKVDGSHNYPGDLRIRFVNLPRKSTISIYSVSGDLQARLYHNNPISGEEIWRQQSRTYFGEVATGIYFFVVESQVAGSEGKKQSGTFAIIKR